MTWIFRLLEGVTNPHFYADNRQIQQQGEQCQCVYGRHYSMRLPQPFCLLVTRLFGLLESGTNPHYSVDNHLTRGERRMSVCVWQALRYAPALTFLSPCDPATLAVGRRHDPPITLLVIERRVAVYGRHYSYTPAPVLLFAGSRERIVEPRRGAFTDRK